MGQDKGHLINKSKDQMWKQKKANSIFFLYFPSTGDFHLPPGKCGMCSDCLGKTNALVMNDSPHCLPPFSQLLLLSRNMAWNIPLEYPNWISCSMFPPSLLSTSRLLCLGVSGGWIVILMLWDHCSAAAKGLVCCFLQDEKDIGLRVLFSLWTAKQKVSWDADNPEFSPLLLWISSPPDLCWMGSISKQLLLSEVRKQENFHGSL